MTGDGGRAELLDLYRIAIDEYRFQVTLNWSRSQYLLVFNLGTVVLSAGVLQAGGQDVALLSAALFLVGLLSCILSTLAHQTQHEYYRAARAHKKGLEERLHLNDLAVATTQGMGGAVRRWGSVTVLVRTLLGALGVANIAGLVVALAQVR